MSTALPVLPRKLKRAHVPCDGCTACCRGDLLVLHPEYGDDPDSYKTMRVTNPLTGEQVDALALGDDGNCVYLGEHGCTIHDRAPALCREFDCRRFYLNFREIPRAKRRRIVRQGLVGKDVLEAGRQRLDTPRETKG